MLPEINFELILDLAIIIIPFLILIVLVFKYVVPKKPALGIGLAIGGSLLAGWLVRRKLKNAFDAESKLATHNKMMAEFKEKQKQRAQAVLANKQVIETLQQQREKLAKDADKYSTELELIDAELKERTELNKKILEDADAFVDKAEERSVDRKKLLQQYFEEGNSISADTPVPAIPNRGTADVPDIEINGHKIIKV